MENTIVYRNRRTLRSTLFGVVMLVFGGTALAATAPTVAPLKFEYKVIDANGKEVTLENKIATGYEASMVAVDGDGNVYVTDAVSNTVSIFNTNGRLVRQINMNTAFAVGVDGSRGLIYVGGALNGTNSIFIIDNNNDDTDDSGNLGTGWGRPSAITVSPSSNVYVADSLLGIVRRIDVQGVTTDYGPYGGERYSSENVKNIYGYEGTFFRTRHRVTSLQGVAVDEVNGLLYVSMKEAVESLSTACQSFSSSGGSDTNCMEDTGESWKYYYDLCPDGSCTGGVTNDSYRYWNPGDVANYPDSASYQILLIDINTGTVRSKIVTGNGDDYAYIPRGLALDGKGRLYVATTGGGTTGGQIKVYNLDVDPVAELTVSGFTSGIHTSVGFSPDVVSGAPKGRLFAAMGDSKTVSAYSIDNGANPANTAPGKPILSEPVNSAVVNTSTPILKIKNATDAENDPLTYAYEICSGSCTDPAPVKVTSAAEITGGANNETSMTVAQELGDSLYHWRAQSFDGELATWSDEATFCIDQVNSIPSQAVVIAPKGERVSPFASTLSWDASTDSDCTNDTITYEVTISDSQGNIVGTFSRVGSTSVNVSDISGLSNGGTYNWTVRAADNKGGNSDYSSGSFTYMTTSATLDSDQTGTKVYIDGNYGYYGKLLGTVPVEKSDIAPGSHFVTFIREDYEPHHAIIYVTDPKDDTSSSSVSYTAAMVAASRIKSSTVGTIKDSSGVDITTTAGSTPFVVDYNSDGVKDVLVGAGDGKVYFYLSEEQAVDGVDKVVPLVSKGAMFQADGSDINVGSMAVPFAVDYDNDGFQDILVGSGDGSVHLYKGAEGGFADAGILALKDGSGNDLNGIVSNVAPAVVDYNNDGKKDLVVGSSDGTLRLYSNTGSDESPVFDVPAAIKADGSDLNVGSDSRAFFTDWNSDGKKDLVVGRGIADSEGNTANLFFNVGTDDVPEFKSISGLKDWVKAKKKERGNKEWPAYNGYYSQDLGGLADGSGGTSPFIVDWEGTSARDVIVGNGSGGVSAYITE